MSTIVRFAPSPTGYLHVGNARIALINWLFARQGGGSFVLRLDDTDLERSTAAFARAIEEDLAWLGLAWDRLERQSARLDRYEEAAASLKRMGRLYPCYETPEELEFKRRRQLARKQPPVYDRAALALSDADRARLEAEGRKPHWRFRLEHEDVAWHDLVRGPVHYHAAHLSDPVLIRGDGTPLYTLPSVVDDLDFKITHVIRGEDHVVNTAVQIQLYRALGGAEPAFAHLPLLVDAQGQGLSKRTGALSLREMRESGIEPMAIASLLASLGSSEAVHPSLELGQLVAGFDIGRFGRAAARFDPQELAHLNARILHETPFSAVSARLPEGASEGFWVAVRPNLTRLDEAGFWWRVCTEPLTPVMEDAELTAQAAALLPPEPWDEGVWGRWTKAVAQASGRKGRALFMPLRQALTGCDHGPELKALLPVIGYERARRRLRGEVA